MNLGRNLVIYSESSEDEEAVIAEDAAPNRPLQADAPVFQGCKNLVVPEDCIKTQRNGYLLNYDGHQFWKKRVVGNRIYWKCINCVEKGCPAVVHSDCGNGEVVKTTGVHSHGRSAIVIPKRNAQNGLKRKAEDSMEKPSQIFNSMLNNLPEAVQAELNKSASRQVVQRKRRVLNRVAPAADHMIFEFPDDQKKYTSGQNESELFLLADETDENGKRILLFGRESNKMWAERMKIVFMDGTFKITPFPFYQTYVILAERDGFVFPVLYALLPDKSQATYERLFRMIKNVWPDFEPSSVSVDYEMAVINALEVCFGETEIWGCLFHLVQNLKKHLAAEGLKHRYETEPDFAIHCRMITAMAFVRPDEIMPVFAQLEELLPLCLEPVLDWFKKNYIGSENRRGVMRPPMFAHSLWNVYERTLNGQHRTNNYAEAANHRIQNELDVCHPGLWNFISCLRSVQRGRDQQYLKWEAGKRPKGKRTKYVQADARILTIVQSYEDRSANEFLRGVARNFVMED